MTQESENERFFTNSEPIQGLEPNLERKIHVYELRLALKIHPGLPAIETEGTAIETR